MTEGERITCPFAPCGAQLTTVPERRLHRGPTLQRIPAHPTKDYEWFGQCPASLLALPLSREANNLLLQHQNVLENVIKHREQLASGEPTNEAPRGRPPVEQDRRPHPGAEPPPMFRAGAAHNHTEPHAGQQGYDRMPVEYLPGTDMGGTMASVAEVRAAIDETNVLLAEAQALSQQTADKLNEAHQRIEWIRQQTADALGGPQVAAALEAADSIGPLCHVAIEANTTYGGTL